MNIVQVAPLMESVPFEHCAGADRGASHLTEELAGRGLGATRFTSRDSRIAGEFMPGTAEAIRLDPRRSTRSLAVSLPSTATKA
jgi:hypothetical protein